MRDELIALAKLSRIDAAARQYDDELEELPARLESMRQDVQALETLLAAEREQLSEAQGLQGQREEDLRQRADALAKGKAKAARARNLKEADAAERELDSNRRAIKERENEIASLGETIASKEASLKEREGQFEEARSILQEEEQAIRSRLEEVGQEREKVVHGRDELAAKVPRSVMQRYERLRQRRKAAVSVIDIDTCDVCRFNVPAQLFIEMQRAEEITTCPNCNTILIYKGLLAELD